MSGIRTASQRPHRRGVAIVRVLGLLTITFAVAFAMMRTQSSTQRLGNNMNLDTLAQQAAITGYSIGLRKIHENAWGGVNTSFSGTLSINQTYTVSYTHGDAILAANDSKQPWRVTILVTGMAADPGRPGVAASQYIQAVTELVPRQTPTNPSTFSTALPYTVYQYANDKMELQPPCQITGNIRLQGSIKLGDDYFKTQTDRDRFFADLNLMRQAGGPDQRTLTGTVSLPTNQSSSAMLNELALLGVGVNDIATNSASGWSFPGVITQYQLYPGGKTYQAVQVGSFLQNTTLTPDPATNPLGIFYRNGQVQLCNGTSITGTLICTKAVICGNPASITAYSLPALDGTTTPVQLPALICSDDMEIQSGAKVTIRGAVALWDDFKVLSGSNTTQLDLQGRVICKGVYLRYRDQWYLSSDNWNVLWNTFLVQLGNVNPNPFYPSWLGTVGLSPTPLLTVKPESSSVRYVWKDISNTVYTAATGDPGLRWSVVRYNDHYNPNAAGS